VHSSETLIVGSCSAVRSGSCKETGEQKQHGCCWKNEKSVNVHMLPLRRTGHGKEYIVRPFGSKMVNSCWTGIYPFFFPVLYEVHAPDIYRRFLMILSREGY